MSVVHLVVLGVKFLHGSPRGVNTAFTQLVSVFLLLVSLSLLRVRPLIRTVCSLNSIVYQVIDTSNNTERKSVIDGNCHRSNLILKFTTTFSMYCLLSCVKLFFVFCMFTIIAAQRTQIARILKICSVISIGTLLLQFTEK